jgi:hypothetical protein
LDIIQVILEIRVVTYFGTHPRELILLIPFEPLPGYPLETAKTKRRCGTGSFEFASYTHEWSLRDSNPLPPHCKCGALPSELRPHVDGHGAMNTTHLPSLHQSLDAAYFFKMPVVPVGFTFNRTPTGWLTTGRNTSVMLFFIYRNSYLCQSMLAKGVLLKAPIKPYTIDLSRKHLIDCHIWTTALKCNGITILNIFRHHLLLKN